MDDSKDKSKGKSKAKGRRPLADGESSLTANKGLHNSPNAMQPVGVLQNGGSVVYPTMSSGQFVDVGASTHKPLSPADVLNAIWRYKWTVIIIFVLVAAPTIAAIWAFTVPQYRAVAEVRVRPIIPYLVFKTEESGAIPLYDPFVNTQVSIIKNAAVLQRVLDEQEVQQTRWYNDPPESLIERLGGSGPTPIERLRSSISAKPRKETEIIDVTFLAYSPGDAELVLDTALDRYIGYIEKMSDDTEEGLYTQLLEQYKSLETEISGREKVCAELKRTLGTGTPEELISAKRVRLDEAEARLAALRQSITVLKWEIERLDSYDGNDLAVETVDVPARQPDYSEDSEWRTLDANVKALHHRIAGSILASNHPDLLQMQNDATFSEQMLRDREGQLDRQWQERSNVATAEAKAPIMVAGATNLSYEEAIRYLEYQLSKSASEEQLLAAELKTQQTEFAKDFGNAQLLEKENSALQHKRELFSAVRQRLDQKNMERNVPGSIEILTPAHAFSKPHNDRRLALTAMVTVLALGVGGGIAFLRDHRRQIVYSPEDVPALAQTPFLGYLPEARNGELSGIDSETHMAESIRRVRTALLSRLNGRQGKTILVTSADEGTGKSTFAFMLGQSLARAHRTVLLIDADLHKMALTRRLELDSGAGLIQALRKGSATTRDITESLVPGLSIMPAGTLEEDDTVIDQIANGYLELCIGKLSKQYDIILFDSPPVLPNADAAILSSMVDGTILIEREGLSRREDVFDALGHIDSAGGSLMGAVFISAGHRTKYGYKHA